MIAIIDYGAGNILSVQKALDYIGCANTVTSDAAIISSADGAVLPGVGSFGDAMDHLTSSGLVGTVREFAASGKPFLGICLGLQVLFDSSEESPEAQGLSLLPGQVRRFPSDMGLKIPHIGWNSVEYDPDCPIFKGLPENPYVYFVRQRNTESNFTLPCGGRMCLPRSFTRKRAEALALRYWAILSGWCRMEVV